MSATVYQTLQYNGTYKRKITWNSMGQCFSYNVCPGDIIDVPASQARNAMGAAPFTKVKSKVTKPKKVRKTSEKRVKESEVAVEETFDVEDLVDPFEVEIEVDVEEDTVEEVMEPEVVVEESIVEETPEVVEEIEVVNEVEEDQPNTDFASMNKTELAEWLIANGIEDTVDELKKNLKDTLIKMCVDKEATL